MDNHEPCRIALIGHDPEILLLSGLRAAGYACRSFVDGAAAMPELEGADFDVLLIDRSLPGIAPATLMTRLRARIGYAVPVIAITPTDDVPARIAALDDGADECLGQPVPVPLLLAHVAAAVRRCGNGPQVEASVGHLRFQPEGTKVRVDDLMVTLTAKEYALALLLCRNLGKPLSRDHIFATIWGDGVPPLTRTLDVHVSRLRGKLALRQDRGFRLSALYGRGYRLDFAAGQAPVDAPVARLIPPRSVSPSGRVSAAHQPQAR